MRRRLVAAAVLALVPAGEPAAAQGRLIEACARGRVEACFALLGRPRLDPGRRAAIELHLAELEALLVACAAGDAAACNTLADRHPDLPADLRPKTQPAPATGPR